MTNIVGQQATYIQSGIDDENLNLREHISTYLHL